MTRDVHCYPEQLHSDSQRGARGALPYPDFLKEKHKKHSQTSHPDYSISYPDMLSGSLTKVSKSYYVIPTACHSPCSATCKAKEQE